MQRYSVNMDPVQQLSQMKITYENGKTKHSQWLKENEDMVGIAEYADYVDKFKQWEQQILSSIAQTEAQIKRRPVAQTPQLPTQDMDGQLYAILENISMTKFTLALVELCKRDNSVFKILTNIVNRETKGTGYHNSLLPSANLQGLPSIPPAFPSMIQLPVVGQHPMQTGYVPYSAPSTSTTHSVQSTPYTQVTPYGVIPADWTIDEPVKRKKQVTPPPRQYTIKMPFNDFSQN